MKGVYTKMDVQLKTASFGGYDKKAVETYIEELQASHEKEVADLKANVMKLSETVKNLHTMREVNLNESSSTIDNLKKVNEELQDELSQLKEKMENYKLKEEESASRYESISRTLLEARESADHLTRQTEQECEAKKAETQTACDQLTSDTTADQTGSVITAGTPVAQDQELKAGQTVKVTLTVSFDSEKVPTSDVKVTGLDAYMIYEQN